MTIKRLVCSGGGAKGVVYVGAYEALVRTGVMAGVKEVAGASAGAINAALIAVGVKPERFRSSLLKQSLKALMGKFVPWSWVTKDGAPLKELVQNEIARSIRQFLDQQENLDEKFQAILKKVRDDPPIVTFGDLKKLRETFPEQFKKLTVTAVSYPDGELQVFNEDETPDVDIALACRASASMPIMLEPVKINGKTYVDGGLYDNLPSDYFDQAADGSFSNNNKKETLILAFGEGLDDQKNPVRQALTKSELIPDAFLERILLDVIKYKRNNKNVNLTVCIDNELRKYNGFLKTEEMNAIREAIKRIKPIIINKLNIENGENDEENSVFLRKKIKQQLSKPTLYHVSFLEYFKRNIIYSWFGGFKGKYNNTERKEVGFQNIRENYAEQTIELRVGNIKTTDFDEAEKIAREMAAMGFLDAMEYQYARGLVKEPEEDLYGPLLEKFELIYRGCLLRKGELSSNNLLEQIQNNPETFRRIIFDVIKPEAEKDLSSPIGFALSLAVEWQNGQLNKKTMLDEFSKYKPPIQKRNISFFKEAQDKLSPPLKQLAPRPIPMTRPIENYIRLTTPKHQSLPQ